MSLTLVLIIRKEMATMIKFRGIPTISTENMKVINANYDGTFVYGNLISDDDRAFIIGKLADVNDEYILPEWWVEVDPKTVEQFTGLTDVNGKNIYVGDIVEAWSNLSKLTMEHKEYEVVNSDMYGHAGVYLRPTFHI